MSSPETPSSTATLIRPPVETPNNPQVKSYTIPPDLESLKKDLIEDNKPQPAYKITKYWHGDSPETTWYEVTLQHNDIAGDPFTDCKSTITVHFSKDQSCEKITFCPSCGGVVSVGISTVRLALGFLPKWC